MANQEDKYVSLKAKTKIPQEVVTNMLFKHLREHVQSQKKEEKK